MIRGKTPERYGKSGVLYFYYYLSIRDNFENNILTYSMRYYILKTELSSGFETMWNIFSVVFGSLRECIVIQNNEAALCENVNVKK